MKQNMKKLIISFATIATLFLVMAIYQSVVSSQTTPFELRQVLNALDALKTKKITVGKVIKDIDTRGVDFELTAIYEDILRKSGATNEIIEAIKKHTPSNSAPIQTSSPVVSKTVKLTVSTKIDEFGIVNANEIKNKLDSLYLALNNYSTATGYIVNFGTAKEKAARTKVFMAAITFRRLDINRVEFVNGGDGTLKTELWVTPQGSPKPPIQTPTNSDNPKTFKNSIGMEFVLIPSGSFMMRRESVRVEKPVHQVTISKSFWMGKTEVTQGQWKAVMGGLPKINITDDDVKWGSFTKVVLGKNKPISYVSWKDVQEYIKKLNTRGKETYRLPTGEEWEYAARADSTLDYVENLDSIAWFSKNSDEKLHDVATKQPNVWGLYDMYGNVSEWIQDGANYYAIIKGGSCVNSDLILRPAYGNYMGKDYYYYYLGFRLVRID